MDFGVCSESTRHEIVMTCRVGTNVPKSYANQRQRPAQCSGGGLHLFRLAARQNKIKRKYTNAYQVSGDRYVISTCEIEDFSPLRVSFWAKTVISMAPAAKSTGVKKKRLDVRQ